MCGSDTVRGVSARSVCSLLRYHRWWSLGGGSAVLLLLANATFVQAASSVVINEIMWDGAEYLELFNPTEQTVALEGWTLTRQQAEGAPKVITAFTAADTIAADDYFLIEKTAGATQVEAHKIVPALTLSNEGELVVLKDSEGVVVDTANRLGMWFAGENTTSGSSMERTSANAVGTEAGSWHTAVEEHSGRTGSPGLLNSTPLPNTPPVAHLSADSQAHTGQTLTFSAEDSEDAEGDELTYSWQFGDGTSLSGLEVSHAYTKTGAYTVTLTVADQDAADTTTQTIIVTTPAYTDAVVVNEVLPNPVGSDATGEFVELYNSGDTAVDLSGWQLDDAEGGSTPYTLPNDTLIAATSYKVWYRSETKLAFNNDADAARLLDPAGAVRTQLTYEESAPEGHSYNRTSAMTASVSSTVTPGAANVITVPEENATEDEDETAAVATGRVAGTSAATVALADIREEEMGTLVRTEGVISAPPGALNVRWFYLAGSGAQVYLHSAAFPDLKLGDKVRVTGTLASYQNETRLKIAQPTDIQKLAGGDPPVPHHVETGEIGEDWEGSLVVVQGEVTQTSGDTFYLDDGSGEIRIVITDAAKIDKPKMRQGMALTITGVVSETRSGYRLLPRFQEDIRMGLVAGLTTFPATGRDNLSLLAGGLVAITLLERARRRHEPLLF